MVNPALVGQGRGESPGLDGTVKVLIVDDDPDIAEMVATLLVSLGHDANSVGSASGALSAALMTEYDLLVCDLMLPDLTGTEIVRALKAQSPRLPVIVMSALDAAQWEQPCLDAGATRFLQKPLNLQDLRSEVTLVEKARLHLNITIIDSDPFHSTRLHKILEALGCHVQVFHDVAGAQQDVQARGHTLVVVDADVHGALAFIKWTKARGAPTFAFKQKPDEDSEDALMRAGAAFLLGKPVDIDALLTQACFLGDI